MIKLCTLSFLILFFLLKGMAATVTSSPNVKLCSSTFSPIGNIVISEAANADFASGAGKYLFLVAPSGFEFDPAAAIAINVGAPSNFSNVQILFRTSSVIAISYDITAINQPDVVTISGVTMRALTVSAILGNVTLGVGSAPIVGLASGATLATVQSAVTISAFTPPASVCSNGAVLALNGTRTLAGGVGGTDTYSGSGVTGSNFNPSTAGVGSHPITFTITTSTPTCIFTRTSSISVTPAPLVTIVSSETSGLNANDNIICNNSSISFQAFGATTYQFRVGGVNTSTTNPFVTSGLALGGNTVDVIGTSGGCSTTTSVVNVTVNSNPSVPTFNPTGLVYTTNAPAFRLDTLSPAVTPAATINSFFSTVGNGIFDRVYFLPALAGPGSKIVTYNFVDGNGCRNSSAPVEITIAGESTPGSITGLNTQYCIYDPLQTISVVPSPGGTNYQFQYFDGISWVDMTTTLVAGSYTASFTPGLLGGPGTKLFRYLYIIQISIPFFPFPPLVFSFPGFSPVASTTINPRPLISVLNQSTEWTCTTEPPELLVFSSDGPGTGIFSSVTPNFVQTNAGNYFIHRSVTTPAAAGSEYIVNLQFTNSTTGCQNTDSRTVKIDRVPAIPVVVTPPAFCQGDFVTGLRANSLTNGTVRWYRRAETVVPVGTSLSPIGGGAMYYSPGVLAANDTFRVSLMNIYNTCTSGLSANLVVTINTPATVDAGVYTDICSSSPSINLAGSRTPGSLAITWSTLSTGVFGGTGINATNPSYTVGPAEITARSAIVYLTTADPDGIGVGCPAVVDFATIAVNSAATVFAGVNTTYCSNNIIYLSGNFGGAASSVSWFKNTLGGPQTDIANPNTTLTTYLPTPAERSGGAITFVIASNDPVGPCPSVNSPVTLTLNPQAIVDPGTSIYTCGSAAVPLAGNTSLEGGANLPATWSNTSGTLAYITTGGAKNFNYNPTLIEQVGGFFLYTLTSDDPDGAGPCLAVSRNIFNIINPSAAVNAGVNATYCSNTNPVLSAVLSGSATSLVWSRLGGAGSINNQNSINTSYLVAPGDYAAGTPITITFTATTNDPDGIGPAGPCLPAISNVDITLNPHLTVTAGPDFAICADQPINLSGNVKLGGIDRVTPVVNNWVTYTGLGGFTENGPSNFTGTYNPSGVITSSGIVLPGSGELGIGTLISVYLKSEDPDGAGPCLADSQDVAIKIYPLPIPHFASTTSVEYCLNGLPILLRGSLGSSSSTVGASATFTGTSFGGSYVAPAGPEFEFDPRKTAVAPINQPNGQTYGIRYTFNDNNACVNHVDTTVRIYPFPQVNFSASTRCQNDTITFTELASVNSAVFPSTEIDWDWYIDGDSVQNVLPPTVYSLNTQSTQYAFANFGIHSIKLNVITNSGGLLNCTNRIDTTLVFGPYPVTNFSWVNPCSVDSIVYTNLTTIAPGYTNAILWNMNGAGGYKVATSPTSLNPRYKFDTPGIYDVELTATTNIYNCERVLYKEVYVVPTYSISPSDPYDSSFATSRNWAPSSGKSTAYSWEHGTPSGKQIINPGRNVWVTNTTGNYGIGEYSYMNSPCFNFQTLDKPMMVLKLWSNTRNLAGAMVEATTGNGNPWVTLGEIGSGINWYNTQGVVGLIGTSPTNPIAQGFSGELNDWALSRIGLSQYANSSDLVRFRLTFGSSSVDDALNRKDGIAFDSIWIGNRSKVVLLEHFTNSLCPTCIEANDTVNSLQDQRPADVVSLHYHTSFPGVDNMNLRNQPDPSSKVLYYGVSSVPKTHLDGTQPYSAYGNSVSAINLNSIDNKALENSKFSIDLTTIKTGLNLTVNTQVVAKEELSQDLILNVGVIERYVSGSDAQGNQSGYRWVLTKMLPDAAGYFISKNWLVGDTLRNTAVYNFSLADFYDTSQVGVVVFLQNYSTKEVYQAAFVSSNASTGATPVITSIQSTDIANNLMIYPVPADQEVSVVFSNELTFDAEYTLQDEVGRSIEKGILYSGSRMLTISTKKYPAGMYHLSVKREDGTRFNKKIIIIH